MPASRLTALTFLSLVLAGAAPAARAATVPSGFVDETIVSGFTDPTSVAFLPGGRMLVTEQRGRVYSVTNGVKSAQPMWSHETEVLDDGDRGLLAIGVDPSYVVNHYVYLLYEVDPDTNGVDKAFAPAFGRLTRYRVSFTDSTKIDESTRTILMGVSWRYGPVTTTNSHAIGCLRWGRDGSLFVSMGDGSHYEFMDPGGNDPTAFGPGPNKTDPSEDIGAFRAQSLSSINGKVLRIDPATGGGYASNPYYDGNPYSVRSRVWAYGLRNAYRFCVRPGTGSADTTLGDPGTAYLCDVGWNTWEEVNVARTPGRNFGWPCFEGLDEQPQYQGASPDHNGCTSFGTADNPAFDTSPVITYDHSDPTIGTPPGFTGNAITGGVFYAGSSYPAQYRGAFFFCDFVAGWLRAATVNGNDELQSVATFATGMGAVVDLVTDPATGDLVYIDMGSSSVKRIRWTLPVGNAAPIAVAAATPAFGTPPLDVSFSSSGTYDPDGDPYTLSWAFGDGASSTLANPTHRFNAAGTYPVVLSADDGIGGIGRDTAIVTVAASLAFPSSPVLDTFNRANGPIGSSWIDAPDGLAVQSNALVSSGQFAQVEWGPTVFGPNQEAYLTIVTPDAGATEQDLMLKVQDTGQFTPLLEAWYSAPQASVFVLTFDPDAGWVTRGTIANVTYAAGQRFGVRALADGTVQVYRNATLVGTASVAAWAYAANGGRIGMSFTDAAAGRWDDFGGGNATLGIGTTPAVTLLSPTGGESWTGGAEQTVSWTASDDAGVTSVDVFYRDSQIAPWTPISMGQPNNGSFAWSVHNTPTTAARVKVVAHDAHGNIGADSSHATFTILRQAGGRIATTLRDFFQPGTQPFEGGVYQPGSDCTTCHGGYDANVEPGRAWKGTMMSQAARDPLFYACLAVAEQDAPSSGDLCIRCHSPMGWLTGKSQPTSGAKLDATIGRDGVSCDLCHRLVDPIYQPGVSPPEDQQVLAGMLPAHVPTGRSNGQYVVDPNQRRRGPYGDALSPHPTLQSSFHTSSDLCATCHDVSNPLFAHSTGVKYYVASLDAPADSLGPTAILPLERTYSEWKNSSYPNGVYAPEFAGNAPGGVVSSCQGCHMREVTGQGCREGPVRSDLPYHDQTGGNAWAGAAIASLYPSEVDSSAINSARNRAIGMLQKAATIDVNLRAEADSFRAVVVVTNHTGHKLPTGYPEGRRMWINIVARNAAGAIVYQSGAYDAASGVLTQDAQSRVYEAKLGLSPAFATSLGLVSGPSFHFALNDTLYQDNRIPPAGFTNAGFAAFGGRPLDPAGPNPRYPDGQNWDIATYAVPKTTQSVTATLWYQTASKEYVDFLKAENTTTAAGSTLQGVWAATGRSAPVAMARDSLNRATLDVPGVDARTLSLRALTNPFTDGLTLLLSLPQTAEVRLEVLDVAGRVVRRQTPLRLEPGDHRLAWDARADDGRRVRPGAYWARVQVGDRVLVKHVVALR